MTPDLLYRSADVPDVAKVALQASIDGVTVHTHLLPPDATAPYVLLTVRAPALAGPMMAGDQTAESTLEATSVGKNLLQAIALGDQVRQVIAGRGGDGAFTVGMTLEGRTVLRRSSNDDGAHDIVKGVPQWTETFQVVVGRAD